MKEIKKVLIILFALLCLTFSLIWLKIQKTEGIRFVKKMGMGINLGNSLDVKGLKERKPEASVLDFEIYWNNPPTTSKLVHSIKDSGFGSVRIPVSWGEHLDEDDIIDVQWMDRVKQVVDIAMDEGLYVILDLHHEYWIIPTEEEERRVKKTLCSVWAQIADTFKEYGEALLFESMNEPRLVDSPDEWNGGTPEMREVVNRLNEAFVNTIRSAGGENKNRYLIIPSYGHSSKQLALESIRLPKDRRLIVAVHAYLPYPFTLQDPGTDQWSSQKETDIAPIRDMMNLLKKTFLDNGVPVMITEFGCADKGNPDARKAWAKYYVYQARKNGIGLFWWDQGGDMKLFNRETGECVEPELVKILTSASQT